MLSSLLFVSHFVLLLLGLNSTLFTPVFFSDRVSLTWTNGSFGIRSPQKRGKKSKRRGVRPFSSFLLYLAKRLSLGLSSPLPLPPSSSAGLAPKVKEEEECKMERGVRKTEEGKQRKSGGDRMWGKAAESD